MATELTRHHFSYELPLERIAQTPAEPRDSARLLVLKRELGSVQHTHIFDLPSLLQPGDRLVLNNTRVLPVRLFGLKPTGGKVELLLTRRVASHSASESWEALTKPGLKLGQTVTVQSSTHSLTLTCTAVQEHTRTVETSLSGSDLLEALHALGSIPTPPYIREFVGNPERYQTVFAKHVGSAAAPTAGLHFTPELLAKISAQGVGITEVTLHVGLGTFLPVTADRITDHHMHAEWYELSSQAAHELNATRQAGGRIIAVGTTSLRTLETVAQKNGSKQPSKLLFQPDSGETELFVYPPHEFLGADALFTNFHTPESTLLMLVTAFTSAPQTTENFRDFAHSLLGRVYAEAIKQEYRFYSFGDAMLIL